MEIRLLNRLGPKALLAPLGALAAVGVLAFLAWLLTSGNDGKPTVDPRGTPNPDIAFAICVQAVELTEASKWRFGADEMSEKGRRHTESAMGLVRQDAEPRLRLSAQVDAGCPAMPSLRQDNHAWVDFGRLVEEPGFYNAFIFVVPDEDLDRLPFELDPRRAEQEHICVGDVCHVEAFALFFAESEVSDETYVAEVFEMSMYSSGLIDLQARQD